MADPADAKAEADFVPTDYVYIGRVLSGTGKVYGKIQQVNGGKLHGDILPYDFKVLKGKVVGCIYTGAKFGPTAARGLSQATYCGRWHDAGQIMDWKIRDDAVATEIRTAKDEQNSKRIDEIESIMLTLRKRYAAYDRQRDHAGKEALEAAVLRALRSAPRDKE